MNNIETQNIEQNKDSKISILDKMTKRAEEALKTRMLEIEKSKNIIEEETDG